MSKQAVTKHFDDGRAPETVYAIAHKRSNFVAPAEITAVAKRGPALPVPETRHVIDVPMHATQHIEMRTSAVDRSKGFLLGSVPMFGAFALGVWLLSSLIASAPLFSFAGLVILWSSFVFAWGATYTFTLMISAEGVSFIEAVMKWASIWRNDSKRWANYERERWGNDD